MSELPVQVVFFDVGGVLLTNGWDRYARRRAAERFGLDAADYDDRHDAVSTDFETGRLSLDQYLARTVFCRPRDFSRDEFVEHMKAQSKPHEAALDLARRLAADGRYLLATLNNESRELNRHRIDTFGLDRIFRLFFSSCYLGVTKPNERIFRIALDVIQREPRECIFLDDRPHNVEAAREAGLYALEFRGDAGDAGVRDLERRLKEFGVTLDEHHEMEEAG